MPNSYIESLELTSELDAVNAILGSVGESPIVSLDDSFVDAEMARDLLRQRLRAVQLKGWTFNTEKDFPLVPDNQGRIFLPANTLKHVFDNKDLVARGSQVYDRAKHTYTFTDDIIARELVLLLPFDECPEAMRLFVTVQAGRRFQDRYQGSPDLHRFQSNDEVGAWASLLNYEADVAEWNLLNRSELNYRLKLRR